MKGPKKHRINPDLTYEFKIQNKNFINTDLVTVRNIRAVSDFGIRLEFGLKLDIYLSRIKLLKIWPDPDFSMFLLYYFKVYYC